MARLTGGAALMIAHLVQIDAFNGSVATPVRLASHDDERLCHLDDKVWWPAIQTLPKLRADYFDGSFEPSGITSPTSSLTAYVGAIPALPALAAHDARLRLWAGELGSDFSSYELVYDGRVKDQPEVANGIATITFGADDGWLDQSLLATYTGHGGIEGGEDLEGQVKPLAIGAPRFAPGTLIDANFSIFQVSAYGAITGVEMAFESLIRFGAPVADYPTFAALRAATISPGTWATCLAQGLVRFGAPPDGLVCFHVAGDAVGGWSRLPGAVIARLATIAGGAGRYSTADIAALNTARPWPISLVINSQTTPREIIQKIAASVNAVAFVDWLGVLRVKPIGVGAPALTLASDGTSLPPVTKVDRVAVGTPYWRLTQGAAVTWQVHDYGDIAFGSTLTPMGEWDATETYRAGHIVTLADGSLWLFVSDTPAVNSLPSASNPDWQLLSGASVGTRVFYLNHFPDDPQIGDTVFRTDQGNKQYRYVGINAPISIGGVVIDVGGSTIAAGEWVLVTDDRIVETIIEAKDNTQKTEAIKQRVTDFGATVVAAQQMAAEARQLVEDIPASITADIDALREQVLAGEGTVETVVEELAAQDARITETKTVADTTAGELVSVRTDLTTQTARITETAEIVATQEARVAILESTIDDGSGSVSEIAEIITTLQGQQASLTEDVATANANASTALEATSTMAGDVATLKNQVRAGGANLLPNGSFADGLEGWNGSGWQAASNSWGPHAYTTLSGTHTLASDPFEFGPDLPYTIASDYAFFAAGGVVYNDVLFFDASDNLLSDGPQTPCHPGPDFRNDGSGRAAIAVSGVSPPGTVKAVARFVSEGGVDVTFAGVRQIKLERGSVATRYSDEASVTQAFSALSTVDTRFAELTIDVDAADAKAGVALTAIDRIDGDTATLYARAAVGVTVGGDGVARWTGLEINGTPYGTGVNIHADWFKISKPGGGARTEYSDGTWRVYAGSIMTVWGAGFGSAGQFVEWTGPVQASLSGCTEANATKYVKTNGDAYFGGSLSAGTLRNDITGTSPAANASALLENIGSNGNPRSVVLSYSWTLARTMTPPLPSAVSPTATIHLFRGADASGALIATLNVGPGDYQVEPTTGGQSQILSSMGGSLTVNDNSGGTTVSYFAVIAARNVVAGGSPSQRITIVCTEQ